MDGSSVNVLLDDIEHAYMDEKLEAERKVAMLWNIGKVIKSNIGE